MPLHIYLKYCALLVAITFGLVACDAPSPTVKLTIIAEENHGPRNGGTIKIINVTFNEAELEEESNTSPEAILDLKTEQITYLEVLGSALYYHGVKDVALRIRGGKFNKFTTTCDSPNPLQGCVGRFGTLASIKGSLNFPTGDLVTPQDQKITIVATGVFDDGEDGAFSHRSPKITIVGRAPPEPNVNLSVSQTIIKKGESVDLSWRTSHTDKLNLDSSSSTANWPMKLSQPNSRFGPVTVSPGQTTRYVLTGTNKFYKNPAISIKEVVVYELYDDPKITFTATPANIERGGEVTLHWSATGTSDLKMVRTSPQSSTPKTIPIPAQSDFHQYGTITDRLTISGWYTYSLTASNPAFLAGITTERTVFVERTPKCRTFVHGSGNDPDNIETSNTASTENIQSSNSQNCAWEYRN